MGLSIWWRRFLGCLSLKIQCDSPGLPSRGSGRGQAQGISRPPQSTGEGNERQNRPDKTHSLVSNRCKDETAAQAARGGSQADEQVIETLHAGLLGMGELVREQYRSAHEAQVAAQSQQQRDGKAVPQRGSVRRSSLPRTRIKAPEHDHRFPVHAVDQAAVDDGKSIHPEGVRRNHDSDA